MFSNKSIIGIFTMLILITASVIFIGAGHEKSTEQATGKMTAEQMMTFMDSNGDGRITRDEAPAELKAGFDFFDQNKDGGIDINEAQILADYANNQAAGKMTAEQMMTFMDSNGDGKITRDEAPADIKAGFDFVDQNKDGGIDINEAQIMADYANNQAAEQAEVQSSTANKKKLQSPTTNENVKYESAAIVDQVGTETIEVWVGNMYFSMEMSGSHQQMITDLKQYLQVEEAVNENMLPSGTQYVAAQVLGLAGYEMKSGWNQPTANGQGSHTIVVFQRKIN